MKTEAKTACFAFSWLALVFLLQTTIAQSQTSANIVIKTQVFRNLIAQNPNLIIEKIINDRFSIEFETIWKRQNWHYAGAELDFGKFYNSKGFSLGISPRVYFSTSPNRPGGWYAGLLFRYSYVNIPNISKQTSSVEFKTIVDISKTTTESGIIFGWQYCGRKKITTELNFGLGHYYKIYREKLISGSPDELTDKEITQEPKPILRWTVGYYLF